jgi:hypothetical protein
MEGLTLVNRVLLEKLIVSQLLRKSLISIRFSVRMLQDIAAGSLLVSSEFSEYSYTINPYDPLIN